MVDATETLRQVREMLIGISSEITSRENFGHFDGAELEPIEQAVSLIDAALSGTATPLLPDPADKIMVAMRYKNTEMAFVLDVTAIWNNDILLENMRALRKCVMLDPILGDVADGR